MPSPFRRLTSSTALVALGAITGLAISARADDQASPSPSPIAAKRVVDLSHVIDPKMPIWPGDPRTRFKTVASFEKDGYFLRSFSMGEHSATHLNSPNSFHARGDSVARYDASQLVRPAVVIDVRKRAAADRDYTLTRRDVAAWEEVNGRIAAGSVVLLNTGWAAFWDDHRRFFGRDAKSGLHFPGFAGRTTRFLLNERKVAGVGTDTHGVDPGQDTAYRTNTQVLTQRRIVLENLDQLDQLPATGTTLVIGVLKLRGGSGSPAAVTALVP